MRMGILTSGGDAPGMNAAVRAAARTAFSLGWTPMKVEAGYKGLLEGRISPVDRGTLGGILQRGGTVLGTQRSEEFTTEEGRRRAVQKLQETGVDALVVIGGEGSAWSGGLLQRQSRPRGSLRGPHAGSAGYRCHAQRCH